MDRRMIIHSAILHISDAKTELDSLLQNNPSPSIKPELDRAYHELDDSIRHCKGIFGPATITHKDYENL